MSLTIKVLRIVEATPVEIRKADRAVQSLSGTSRGQTLGLFDQRCVWLNGLLCAAPWQRLSIGDTIEVRYDPSRRYAPLKKPPRPHGFDILFEDEHLIVVNKPAHCLTVPTPNRETNTLIDRVSSYLTNGNRRRGINIRAVHRLDRGVSGVLVFAKSRAAKTDLRRQFESHQPEREYLAIVAGRLTEAGGTLRGFMATDKRLRRYTTHNPNVGELAVTHYRLEQVVGDTTLVRIRLETGRRNQIRVQFAEAGHPILGDRRYEPGLAKHRRWTANRLALHAAFLAFDHPQTGKRCHFEVPVPIEFQRFLDVRRI